MKIPDWLNPFKRKQPPKLRTAKNLQYAFTDNAGVRYYRINTQLGVGLEHYTKVMEFTMYMAAGLAPKETNMLLDLQESAINNLVMGKKGGLEILGWVNQEMRLRQKMVIHTELLYNFIACHYLREDEPLTEWIESIHNEKVTAFKECVKTQTAYSFFQLPELKNLTGISHMSPDEWTAYWNASIREQKELIQKVDYLKSVISSAKDRKTSTKAS